MQKKIYFVLVILIVGAFTSMQYPQEDYLKITANVEPLSIKQGKEGILKIKIIPRNGIKISSHPEFIIKLDKNNNLAFSKVFFTSSELDFSTSQENGTVFLDLEKEVPIYFKVNEDSLIGKHKISGEVVFTAVLKDKNNWALKTYQKFYADFVSKKNFNIKVKRK